VWKVWNELIHIEGLPSHFEPSFEELRGSMEVIDSMMYCGVNYDKC
jgi:hypothetical protein